MTRISRRGSPPAPVDTDDGQQRQPRIKNYQSWRCPPPPGVNVVYDRRGRRWAWGQPYWHCGMLVLSGARLAKLWSPLTDKPPPPGGSDAAT
jgi:hypothetical protein